MDILGLTFEQVQAAVQPRAHDVRALRAAYRGLLRGENPPDGVGCHAQVPAQPGAGISNAAMLHADVLPIVRQLQDGDLTKFVQRTHDGLEIESVVVPMQRTGGIWKTLCVSTQIGCARGCTFCETGQLGLLRNLTPGEIVGQVVAAGHAAQPEVGGARASRPPSPLAVDHDVAQPPSAVNPGDSDSTFPTTGPRSRVRNVVFMGMGEPLDNYDNVIQACRVLLDGSGLSFAGERLTISTVGRIAGIRKLATLGWRRLNLAVSLNAPNDEIRSQIMPHNRLEPMAELREALLAYPLRKCQFFMMEYVLIPGVNDAREHAREVAEYLRPLKCMLNLIPYNPRHDSPWPAPSIESIKQFLAWLVETGQGCKLRITKGREHMAACGQLGNRDLARRPG